MPNQQTSTSTRLTLVLAVVAIVVSLVALGYQIFGVVKQDEAIGRQDKAIGRQDTAIAAAIDAAEAAQSRWDAENGRISDGVELVARKPDGAETRLNPTYRGGGLSDPDNGAWFNLSEQPVAPNQKLHVRFSLLNLGRPASISQLYGKLDIDLNCYENLMCVDPEHTFSEDEFLCSVGTGPSSPCRLPISLKDGEVLNVEKEITDFVNDNDAGCSRLHLETESSRVSIPNDLLITIPDWPKLTFSQTNACAEIPNVEWEDVPDTSIDD